jgi:small-conductance mechanosensitive channel
VNRIAPLSRIAPQVIAIWSGRIVLALVATFLLGWILRRLGALVAWVTDFIDTHLEKLEQKGGVVQKAEIFSRRSVLRVAEQILGVLRWGASLLALYLWLIACAFALDKTGRVADAIVNPFIGALGRIGTAAIGFLPNLVVLIAIALVARLVTHVVTLFSRALEEGRVEFPWLPPDLAVPTRRIVNILVWLIALIVGMPYLPGSDSRAFQGVSIMVGVLISLGSTSATANLLSGLLITYARTYRVGDRVKIGDTVGVVQQLGAFVTRVRTPRDEEVIIPNAVVQTGMVINYTRYAGETGVQVSSTVTIGYDVPWRTVHRLLISAAGMVDGVMLDPEPYVLQTSLDDFYVRYELLAFSNRPDELHLVQGRLNQAIQDSFFRDGVEICSPHFHNYRDGNQTTVPDEMRGMTPEIQVAPVMRPLPKPMKVEYGTGRRSQRPGALDGPRSVRPKT